MLTVDGCHKKCLQCNVNIFLKIISLNLRSLYRALQLEFLPPDVEGSEETNKSFKEKQRKGVLDVHRSWHDLKTEIDRCQEKLGDCAQSAELQTYEENLSMVKRLQPILKTWQVNADMLAAIKELKDIIAEPFPDEVELEDFEILPKFHC